MNTHQKHRRIVLKMIARLRLIIKRTSPLATRYASVTVLVLALGVMLTALTVAKLGGARSVLPRASADDARGAAVVETAPQTVRPVPLAKRDTLVYIIDGDSKYYHTCACGASDCKRQAVTLTVAKARDLVPCPVCTRAGGEAGRPVVNR
ncbi:MAG TPA: hypothetical protein PLF26_00055 [Blastocatellia bacterium]|nr:hypothetical protein [Blastocatellia bacterium]